MESSSPPLKMERRMAVLFLLALALIVWQALRTKPVEQPAFEIATNSGERLSPLAVPSWRPPLDPPADLSRRLAFLEEHAVQWPGMEKGSDCRLFLRISSRHWAARPVSGMAGPWQLLHLPSGDFLDDDDGDGDPLDSGELRESGPGAEAEVFCS